MSDLKCPQAYVDFTHADALSVLASKLSERLFGGIPFEGENEGIWDEVPALRLSRDILGLRVEIGGRPGDQGGYTLQVEAVDFPWESVQPGQEAQAVADLSDFVAHRLRQIDGVRLKVA